MGRLADAAVSGTHAAALASRRAGAWLWAAPWAYIAVGIAALCIALALPRALGLLEYDLGAVVGRIARYLPILGMALAVGDAARSEERRAYAVVGFCLNVLSLFAWAVASVLLHATQPPELG